MRTGGWLAAVMLLLAACERGGDENALAVEDHFEEDQAAEAALGMNEDGQRERSEEQ